jgi:hypothetical protein
MGYKNAHGWAQNTENGFDSALTFLECSHKDSNEFLCHIIQVTGDESWVSFAMKYQSKQWMHTHSPYKPKSTLKKHCLPARKLMVSVFGTEKVC